MYLNCLCFTTNNAIITTEINSPIRVITNNVVKAAITPLLSSEQLSFRLPSLLVSFKQLEVTIKGNR